VAYTGFYHGGSSAWPEGSALRPESAGEVFREGQPAYCPTQQFSYILSTTAAADGLSSCILGAFCTKKLYAMLCNAEKALLGSHVETVE